LRKKAIERGIISEDDKLSKKDLYDLIFLPGFSTAQSLTEVSGRGVGMDVVKRKITEVRGEVEIDSEIGLGTSFTLKLQQTISIIDTLLMQVGKTFFIVPISEIEVCGQKYHNELFETQNRRVSFQGDLVPFVYLRNEFDIDGNIPEKEKLIVINKNNKRFALVVDKIIGEYQAVLKPLGKTFKKQEFLAGVSVLGDGNLALMLDTVKLMNTLNQ
jgi:two-component system chemotaxis sensor kinase CheA